MQTLPYRLIALLCCGLISPTMAQDLSSFFHPLPSRESRRVVGEWIEQALGPLRCSLIIINSNNTSMLYRDCNACSGPPIFSEQQSPLPTCLRGGMPLSVRGPHRYFQQTLNLTYTIRTDGQLSVTRVGAPTNSAESLLRPATKDESLSALWQ